MRRTWLLTLSVLLTLSLCAALSSAADEPTSITTQVARVALFKNGLGFFVRHADLPDRPGPVRIGPLPAAVHGSLWLSYDPGVRFLNLSASRETSAEQRDALTLPEILRANLGKQVRLELAGQPPSWIEGTLKAYPLPPVPVATNPYMADSTVTSVSSAVSYARDGSYSVSRDVSNLLLIETGDNVVAVSVNSVTRAVFEEAPSLEVPLDRRQVVLQGDLAAVGRNDRVTFSYLTKGITWAPSYLLDISREKEATLTAKAEIINEIEDLDNVSVELITGFPYLEFSGVISPLAKKGTLASFLGGLPSGAGQRRARDYGAGAVTMQDDVYNLADRVGPPGPEGPAPTPSYGVAAAGSTAEDLFLYPLDNVSLKKDAVGYYPLFTEKVKYEHLYTWDVPDYVNEQASYYWRSLQEQSQQIVWHQLVLTNGSKLPWTTAPVEILADERVVAQSTLTYTAVGLDAMVKITQALQVKAEEAEFETARERGITIGDGSTYDRVTLEGRLALTNTKDEVVKMRVTKLLSGEVKTQVPEAKVEKLARGLRSVNPRVRLTWELTLDGGQQQEIKYTYQVLLRR